MTRRACLLGLWAAALLCLRAGAAEWRVSSARGVPSRPCGAPAQPPCAQLQEAVDQASDGDTVWLAADAAPYRCGARIANKALVLAGEPGAAAGHARARWQCDGASVALSYVNAPVDVSGLEVRGASTALLLTVYAAPVARPAPVTVRLDNCAFDSNAVGVSVSFVGGAEVGRPARWLWGRSYEGLLLCALL